MRNLPLPAAGDDAGFSLIELVTAMAITAVFGAVFTTGLVEAHRITNEVEATTQAQTQVRLAPGGLRKSTDGGPSHLTCACLRYCRVPRTCAPGCTR